MSDSIHRTDDLQGDIVHVYDGIEEADNRLPRWWLWTFYTAVIFGCCYWLFFNAFHFGKSPIEQFAADRLAAMNTGEPVTDEELVAMMGDKISLAEGKKVFGKVCSRCHGSKGEGKIGPNLTDPNWIVSGAPLAIYDTINRGRGGKGMQAWGPTYGRGGVMQLAAYVMTIQDTNVPGKAPQGKVWVRPEPEPEPESESEPESEPTDAKIDKDGEEKDPSATDDG